MYANVASDIRSLFGQDPAGIRLATRCTLNGSKDLERHLANICKKVLVGIRRFVPENKLEGIALGGGYGRGEGGVLQMHAGDQPYNDLEFYVFVRGHPWLSERRYSHCLHTLSAELVSIAGVELEFTVTSPAKMAASSQNLFYHDLIMGHRWLLGDDSLFAGCEHHRVAETLPLTEATRLVMNRCSGLLFARDKLEHENLSAEDADFVFRNIAKTKLALGDAVLIAFGEYHWSCLVRGRRLSDLAAKRYFEWTQELRECHAAGVDFKLQPHRSILSRDALCKHFRKISAQALGLWLWLENRRLGCDFRSAADYASSGINKWPGESCWRNMLANVKVFGPRALLFPCHRRHPRERILNALALLLWGEAGPVTSHQLARRVQHELLLSQPSASIPAFRERWRRAS